jgi:hypothetical protein
MKLKAQNQSHKDKQEEASKRDEPEPHDEKQVSGEK